MWMMPPCCSGRGYGSSIICVPRFELRCGWCRPCCSGRGPEAVGSTVFCSRSQHCYQCENLRTHSSSIPSPPSVPVCSKAFPTTPSSTEILIGFSPAISFVFQDISYYTFEHRNPHWLFSSNIIRVPRHFLLYLRAQKYSLGFLQQYHLCSKAWVPMWMMPPCYSGRGPEAVGSTVSCSCS